MRTSSVTNSTSIIVCSQCAMVAFEQPPGGNTTEGSVPYRSVRLTASVLSSCVNFYRQVFGFPPTEYHVLSKVEEQLEPFYKLWNMISDFQASRKEWLHGSFLGTLLLPFVFASIR